MARRRLPYGPTTTLTAYPLLDGEVATDITEHRFRIGDGVTPGGVPQARKDEVDARVFRDATGLENPTAWRAALSLGDSALRMVGPLPGNVADGGLLTSLAGDVATLALNSGTTKSVETVADLASIPTPALYDRAEVRDDPLGDVEDGNGVWSWTGSAWEWLSPLVPASVQAQLDAMLYSTPTPPASMQVWLEDEAGIRVRIDTGGVYFDAITGAVRTPLMDLAVGASDSHGIWIEDDAGIRAPTQQPDGSATAQAATGDLWRPDQYDWAEARGAAEALRMNSLSVSAVVGIEDGANLSLTWGQSWGAGSVAALLVLDQPTIDRLGLDFDARTIGPESRGVSAGATWVAFNGDDSTLYPLAEHYIGQTGTDTIYTAGQVAAGSYPVNARGGVPETVSEFVTAWLRRNWLGKANTADPDYFTVAMNVAKAEGSLVEVSTGDGASRTQSAVNRFASVLSAFSRNCYRIVGNHTEHDEAAGNEDYTDGLHTWQTAMHGYLNTAFGQTTPPMMLMHLAAGPAYGSADLVVAGQVVDMWRDDQDDNASIFPACIKYECPSGELLTNDHPLAGNGHSWRAGTLIMGVREAVTTHYVQDRKEYYWPPFPFESWYEDNQFLLVVPNKFPPLREVPMVAGHETVFLDHLGISFEAEGGGDNPVTWARVVPGYRYLIEGRTASPIAGTTTCRTAKLNLPLYMGLTNIRDSFTLDLPFDLSFGQAQTIYTGGYQDSPTTNGVGRHVEDIAGWVGKLDWGNPLAPYTLTAQPMPE